MKIDSGLFVNIVRHASTNLNTLAVNSAPEWSHTVRALACVVMFGIGLQSFFLAGLRTAERAHFHSAPASMPSLLGHNTHDAHDAHDAHDDEANMQRELSAHIVDAAQDQAGGEESGHPHTHPHNHTHAAIHDHGSDRNDVVYVSSDDGDDTPLPALTRLPLDLDGYFLKPDLPFTALPTRVVFADPPSYFRTRTELPPERPPRRRA